MFETIKHYLPAINVNHIYFGQWEQQSINIEYKPWLNTCLLMVMCGSLTNQKHRNHIKMCEPDFMDFSVAIALTRA